MTRKTEISNHLANAMTLTRRGFVKMGGALFVSFALPAGFSAAPTDSPTSLDPTLLASWLEIRTDNTIRDAHRPNRNRYGNERVLRAGDCRGIERAAGSDHAHSGRHRQDAGWRLLRWFSVWNDQRSQSRRLHLPGAAGLGLDRTSCSDLQPCCRRRDRFGGGKSISYGQLVQGQHLDLKIPVSGQPTKVDPGRVHRRRGVGRFLGDRRSADETGEPVQGDRDVLSGARDSRTK